MLIHVRFSSGNGLRTDPSNPWFCAGFPNNAPTLCSGYVAIDIVRNARLDFGRVRKQITEKHREKWAEPERKRFAQTETEGHSGPSFGEEARQISSVGSRKPL